MNDEDIELIGSVQPKSLDSIISVRVQSETLAWLRDVANLNNMSVSELIRQAAVNFARDNCYVIEYKTSTIIRG